MSRAIARQAERKVARKRLDELHESESSLYAVHYVCESLLKEDGSSPRIIAIAVCRVDNRDSQVFSIHVESEIRGLGTDPSLTSQQFDELERALLEKFYNFVASHSNAIFLHWKMRSSVYGFGALAHRCEVLGCAPTQIAIHNRYDLSEIVRMMYGKGYTKKHPHLVQIVRLNNITSRDLIPGPDEPAAFVRGAYRALHNSAVRKAQIISEVYRLAWSGDLKTEASKSELYGNSIIGAVAIMRENPWFSVIELVFAVIGLIATIASIWSLF